MSRLNPGRLAAARVLLAVERGAHAEDLLAEQAPAAGPDRGLAWHLVLGVLRRQGSLDAVLTRFLKKPIEKLDAVPRIAMRIGLFESALSKTSNHAAVDQAVELTRRLRLPRTSGLVNAVLRKAIRVTLPDDPLLDLPPWLQERWADHTDWVRKLQEPAVVCLATADRAPPPLPARPATAGGDVVHGVYQALQSGAVTSWEGFRDGGWWVMDPAAAAVAQLCQPEAGLRVLDACAAPGGKSFWLASGGATVTAVDTKPERLALLRDSATRLGLDIEVVEHDWLTGPMGEERYDVVLVDAPCTGLGVVRRHPEIRWRRLPSDPAAMAFRQQRILKAAAAHVREGGRLVYAVCSPMREEGEAVAASMAGWSVSAAWSAVPPQGDEDAFQAFVLERS
jgi:16S rRNA (cytosine967-C5)-methyltransferase